MKVVNRHSYELNGTRRRRRWIARSGAGLLLIAAMGAITGCGNTDSAHRETAAHEPLQPGTMHETGDRAPDDKGTGARNNPVAGKTENGAMQPHVAMFGAGCFWGVEETFRQTKGVVKTEVGYAGGTVENPTYKQVCSDRTGHAEVVRVEFDPNVIRYEELLDVFWNNHNPTTLNRQGPDIGSQYRSVIFYFSPAQKSAAEESKSRLERSGKWKKPIVTEIVAAAPFWRAEEYHQQYLAKRGLSHCHVPDEP